MKIEIRVGEINTESPRIPWDSNSKLDDFELEKKRMYDFLAQNDKCVIINVDMFLLYTLNSALASFLVKDNPKSFDDEDFNKLVKLDPDKYKIYEIDENGIEKNIQTSSLDGKTVGRNYFNVLMGAVMDDYYDALNYVEYKPKKK